MKGLITILGAGESGTGAALLAKAKGYGVFVSDFGTISDHYKGVLIENSIDFEEGKHSLEKILSSEEVVKSPGISDSLPIIKSIEEKGIPVIDEIEFAFRYCDGKIVAITGTNGKTTTTLLTNHIMKSCGLDVVYAGNIGNSFAKEILNDPKEWYVLEVSSFQLDHIDQFKPDISVLLNITPDHLDRYEGSMELYSSAKFRIIKNADESSVFIHFNDDQIVADRYSSSPFKGSGLPISLSKKVSQGAYVNASGELVFNIEGNTHTLNYDNLNNKFLRGEHNKINLMAALLTTLKAGASWSNAINSLESFKNASHRLEFIAEINGVEYINDSKATNLDSFSYALSSFNRPIIWIAGGIDKGNDYSKVYADVVGKVKGLILLGKDNEKLRSSFGNVVSNIIETEKIEEAVAFAQSIGEPGDVVLLSPACASFDLFKNYEDRGERFKRSVLELENSVL
ncbi:MAG: UDP-N-acetylmuramoyl-L-alanine--D-glutamate ligase [Bacteroidota bacterium]